MVTPAGKRKAVAHLVEAHGMSERRACKAIGCCRMTMRYQTTRADDAGIRQRMKAIAQERRRFGYRRLHVLLKREGYVINHKRLFRLYREEKLAVRRRGGRKRAIGTRADAGSDGAQRPLVARLRVGSTHRLPPLPHPDHRR
jgi:putative transposase